MKAYKITALSLTAEEAGYNVFDFFSESPADLVFATAEAAQEWLKENYLGADEDGIGVTWEITETEAELANFVAAKSHNAAYASTKSLLKEGWEVECFRADNGWFYMGAEKRLSNTQSLYIDWRSINGKRLEKAIAFRDGDSWEKWNS